MQDRQSTPTIEDHACSLRGHVRAHRTCVSQSGGSARAVEGAGAREGAATLTNVLRTPMSDAHSGVQLCDPACVGKSPSAVISRPMVELPALVARARTVGPAMTDDTAPMAPYDMTKVDPSRRQDLRYWTRTLGVSDAELVSAVAAVGTASWDVRAELRRRRRPAR